MLRLLALNGNVDFRPYMVTFKNDYVEFVWGVSEETNAEDKGCSIFIIFHLQNVSHDKSTNIV